MLPVSQTWIRLFSKDLLVCLCCIAILSENVIFSNAFIIFLKSLSYIHFMFAVQLWVFASSLSQSPVCVILDIFSYSPSYGCPKWLAEIHLYSEVQLVKKKKTTLNKMKLFNPILYLKCMLNTVFNYLLRIQFLKVVCLRLSGNFQNLQFKVKYHIQTKPRQSCLGLICGAMSSNKIFQWLSG